MPEAAAWGPPVLGCSVMVVGVEVDVDAGTVVVGAVVAVDPPAVVVVVVVAAPGGRVVVT